MGFTMRDRWRLRVPETMFSQICNLGIPPFARRDSNAYMSKSVKEMLKLCSGF